MKYGDLREWSVYTFYESLRKIVDAKSDMDKPYGVLVYLKEGYGGTLAKGNSNELLHSTRKEKGEKTVDLSGKSVSHNIIVLLPEHKIPPFPILGTCCFKVDNKLGRVDCLWICPRDKPVVQNFEVAGENEIIARSGQNVPLVYA